MHRNRFRGPYVSRLHTRVQKLTSRLLRTRHDRRCRGHIGAVDFNPDSCRRLPRTHCGATLRRHIREVPAWLLAEPIVCPRHDRTYGWACRVPGCEGAPTDMQLQFMCWGHTHQYREVRESLSVQEFFGQANPFRSMLGRGPEGGLAAETVETTARRADWDTAARSSHTSVTRHRQI